MNRLRPHSACPGLDDDRGTALTWLLGLLMMILALGGLSVDLWRAFSERRLVAGAVDAVATAGASGLDEDHLRATGEARLDPVLARQRAATALATHGNVLESPVITVASDGSSITVSGTREVRLTLARLIDPIGSYRVGAEATSSPRRTP